MRNTRSVQQHNTINQWGKYERETSNPTRDPMIAKEGRLNEDNATPADDSLSSSCVNRLRSIISE